MKRLIFIITFVLLAVNSNAQETGKVNIGIIMPEHIDGMNAAQLTKLKTKLEAICAKNEIYIGVVPEGFVIYPVIEIGESMVSQGGMKKIYSLNIDLTLIVKQIEGVGIMSMSKTYKGNGDSEERAVTNAITSISIQDGKFLDFINKSREAIMKYYESNMEKLLNNAKMIAKQGCYEKAIAILQSIPIETPNYEKVNMVSNDIYLDYINKTCEERLFEAKSAIAMKDYQEAAKIIAYINPKSSCYSQAEELMTEIKMEIGVKEKQDLELKIKQYEDNLELEQSIIEASRAIAIEYYKNQPQINYYEVVAW